MLARRFTIVCLLAALFGMGLAMLAAQGGSGSIRSTWSKPELCTMAPFGPCQPGLFR